MVEFVDDRLHDAVEFGVVEDEAAFVQAPRHGDIDAIVMAVEAAAFVPVVDLGQEMGGFKRVGRGDPDRLPVRGGCVVGYGHVPVSFAGVRGIAVSRKSSIQGSALRLAALGVSGGG